MKEQHSPGAWKATRRKAPPRAPHRSVWDVTDEDGSPVCRVSNDDAVTGCADAKLIRCAPELLEFVKEIVRFIRQEEEELDVAGYGPPMSFYLERAEALVRRASLPPDALIDVVYCKEWP